MSTLGLSNCFNLSYGEIKSNTSGHTIIGNLAISSTTILERKTSHFICRRKTRAVNSQRLLKDFTSECFSAAASRFSPHPLVSSVFCNFLDDPGILLSCHQSESSLTPSSAFLWTQSWKTKMALGESCILSHGTYLNLISLKLNLKLAS